MDFTFKEKLIIEATENSLSYRPQEDAPSIALSW